MTFAPYLPLLLSMMAHGVSTSAVRPHVTNKAMTACAAATRMDVAEALGRMVEQGEEHTDRLESTCDYASKGGQVTIAIHHSAARLDPGVEIANLKAAIPQAKVRNVAGIGTRAFFLDLADSGTQLHIIRGEHDYLLISVLGFGDAEQVSLAAEKIARKALERL